MAEESAGPGLPHLARLEAVNARDVWPHEAHDFTPWLLANPEALGDALGMDLELSAAEHPVGTFALDLIGVDRATGEMVIIENQLAPTDHVHLGQLLTYAGGTDAVNVIWIATRFREEHRAALDWLNTRTDESTRFFGVEVGVVRIGSSPPAPLMRLVAQPNDWGKSVKAKTQAEGGSSKGQAYQKFWMQMLAELSGRQLNWTRSRKGLMQNWLAMPSGTTGITFNCSFGRSGLCSEIFFESPDPAVNDARLAAAQAKRELIERTYGGPLTFDPLIGKKGCRIADHRAGQIGLTENWQEYVEWFIACQIRLRMAMSDVFGLLPGTER
ncbi:hypothetical protein PSN13_05187 [Micromonospora saelicesensis]|uniref:DUF4268 domain-containing protein n=1 Tax=Micromonospora saelicesensis TaxID=285676 RepID=A0A328NN70_9ACTN|nr:DUF4268 domain-containing protein [Micromonospora saelicesensis]RAO29988.1 hypothetical protein PSN13_05187 [Micromonospora saelicesensis]